MNVQNSKLFLKESIMKNPWSRFILINLIIVPQLFFSLEASDFSIEPISGEGSIHSAANAIVQDTKGFLWVASYNGLYRYDGYEFKLYSVDPEDPESLGHNTITSLIAGNNGDLWIGTFGGGLNKYNAKSDAFIKYLHETDNNNSISHNNITTNGLFLEHDSILWIGCDGGGVNRFVIASESFTQYLHNPDDFNSLSSNRIACITGNNREMIYIGTYNAGINILNTKTGEIIRSGNMANYPSELYNATVSIIFLDSNENIWLGAEGIVKYDGINYTRFTTSSDSYILPSDEINSICETSHGQIWFGSLNGIIIMQPDKNFFQILQSNYCDLKSLSSNLIESIYEDANGVLWIGTRDKGLNKKNLYAKKFVHLKAGTGNENALSHNNICAFYQEDSILWIGTRGGGINKYNLYTGKNEILNVNNSFLNNNNVLSLYKSRDNYLWIGTEGGGVNSINLITGENRSYLHDPGNQNSLLDNSVFDITEDLSGNLWFALWGGLDKFNPNSETFLHYKHDKDNIESLGSIGVFVVFNDSEGDIWAGTAGGGLNKYEKDSEGFTRFNRKENDSHSISYNVVVDIKEDEKGNLLIATSGGGLNIYNKVDKQFTRIDKTNGLSSNVVQSIVIENNERIWLATDKGLSRLNRSTGEIINFDESDGLQGNQFNMHASLVLDDARIVLGGTNGLNIFNPESIIIDTIKPRLQFTEFRILNEQVEIGKSYFGNIVLEKSLSSTDHIKLSYKCNVISFKFAALHFVNPEKNLYRYKLDGFRDEWIRVNAKNRQAIFTNLPGGNYTLRVQAANQDGIWNENGLSLEIQIIPPFWKTLWFYLIVGLILLLVIIYLIRFRERKLMAEKTILKEKIEKGLKEVETQRNLVVQQAAEFEKKEKEYHIQKWHNEGIFQFEMILSKYRDNIKFLSNNIIRKLVDYLEIEQAGFIIYNDDNPEDPYLQLLSAYSYDKQKLKKKRIEIDEGQIGACFSDKNTIYISDLPDRYMTLESGLGHSSPKYLLLVPLVMDEITIGVLELASFRPIEDHKIKLVEKLSENIAYSISTVKANIKAESLYVKTKNLGEEMHEQEEALRKNLEELRISQEKLRQKEGEWYKKVEEFSKKEEAYLKEIESLKKSKKVKPENDKNHSN